MNKRKIGELCEEYVVEYINKKGYTLKDKNFRMGRTGEIDIIAENDDFLCFIEVKARSIVSYGYPKEAVDYRKQQKIINISRYYIMKNSNITKQPRFDVAEVFFKEKDNDLSIIKINIIESAFTL